MFPSCFWCSSSLICGPTVCVCPSLLIIWMSTPFLNSRMNSLSWLFVISRRLPLSIFLFLSCHGCREIDTVVHNEDYGGYVCKDQQDYEENIQKYSLVNELKQVWLSLLSWFLQSTYPITMDFTSTVPKCFNIVTKYVNILLSFAKSISIFDIESELFDVCPFDMFYGLVVTCSLPSHSWCHW